MGRKRLKRKQELGAGRDHRKRGEKTHEEEEVAVNAVSENGTALEVGEEFDVADPLGTKGDEAEEPSGVRDLHERQEMHLWQRRVGVVWHQSHRMWLDERKRRTRSFSASCSKVLIHPPSRFMSLKLWR